MWKVETITDTTDYTIRDSIYELSDNSLAAIRIPGIYTNNEIDVILDNIEDEGVAWYENFELKQGRIGICATEFASRESGKDAYFSAEAEWSQKRDRIFPGALAPVQRMMDIFSPEFSTAIAREPSQNDAKYFTGLIRAMKQESTTHFDYAPHQLPGWQVAQAAAQFAVVTYLQTPENGGGLTVYNRQWQLDDDKFNKDMLHKGPEGFEQRFLKNEDSATIKPEAGEMIIFNSRNFHKVEKVASSLTRYSINSFMSLSGDKLEFWN